MANNLKLVTGRAGVAHITSHDDGERNQGIWNDPLVILPVAENMVAQVISSNRVDILTGGLVFQGRHATLTSAQQLTITSATAGQNRSDLIIVRYTSNNGIESMEFDVLTGTATSGTPTDPTGYTEGDIQSGDTTAEYPMYRVNISGASITSVDLLCSMASPLRRIDYGTVLPSTTGYADGSVFMLYEA